ncbi:hypothetical protein Q7L71_27935, partial [Conexibacter sp. CPCC 205706]
AAAPAAPAAAARAKPAPVAAGATDPSTSGTAVAWRTLGAEQRAIGGGNVATAAGGAIVVAALATPDAPLATISPATGVSALAVSATHVAWRAPRAKGGDVLLAAALPPRAADDSDPPPSPPDPLAVTGRDAQLSRPSLDGNRLAYAVATRHSSRIVVVELANGAKRTVLRSRRTQLSQPALHGDALLYVQARACDQRLRLKRAGRATRTLLTLGTTARRDEGHEHHHTAQGSEPTACPRGTPPRTGVTLWSTALDARAAYVTLLRAATRSARIVRISRR